MGFNHDAFIEEDVPSSVKLAGVPGTNTRKSVTISKIGYDENRK